MGCDGLLCLLTDIVDRALLEHCPQLRVVSSCSVGVDHIDVAAATELGIAVGPHAWRADRDHRRFHFCTALGRGPASLRGGSVRAQPAMDPGSSLGARHAPRNGLA